MQFRNHRYDYCTSLNGCRDIKLEITIKNESKLICGILSEFTDTINES